METLESYLNGDYHEDKNLISDIKKVVADSVPIFWSEDFWKSDEGWPFSLSIDGEQIPEKEISVGNTATAVLFLLAVIGRVDESVTHPWICKKWGAESASLFDDEVPKINTRILDALGLIEKKLDLDKDEKKPDDIILRSNTFGKNDIFSFVWLSQLRVTNWFEDENFSKERCRVWEKINSSIANEVQKFGRANLDSPSKRISLDSRNKGYTAIEHAFPVLRMRQAFNQFKDLEAKNNHQWMVNFFSRKLHTHLSYYSISDGRFDPAEIIFCLEGLLQCGEYINGVTISKVFEVLGDVKNAQNYWSPVKPFLSNTSGWMLFPMGAQVANSLLRISHLLMDRQGYDEYNSHCIGLLKRYLNWLKARMVIFNRIETPFSGWHFDRIHDTKLIHFWKTSQVLLFLTGFRNLLENNIARTSLKLSRFESSSKKSEKKWESVCKKMEPVSFLGDNFKVYKQIGDYFSDRESGDEVNYSMLLYGPPGTGKTTIAEELAKYLEFDFITITISDFLAGGAEIEARAKMIFDVLEHQTNCVVLFDEIDSLLLDRDSDHYNKQDTIFQFMTPGMLTKINDLRKKKKVIFIIATNYANRIDPAIKRTGRIDHQLLVLPPDKDKRRNFLTEGIMKKADKPTQDKLTIELKDDAKWKPLLEESLFFGISDLIAVLKNVHPKDSDIFEQLEKAIGPQSPTINLEIYLKRLDQGKEPREKIDDTLIKEYFGLLALKFQIGEDITDDITGYGKIGLHLTDPKVREQQKIDLVTKLYKIFLRVTLTNTPEKNMLHTFRKAVTGPQEYEWDFIEKVGNEVL